MSLVEYPADYPFKVIGLAADDLADHLVRLFREAVPGIALGEVRTRPSSAGKYLSVTIDTRLDSEEQRVALYRALAADARVVHYL